MNSLLLHPPAKLNLYLRLTGKRKDGYNNLVTVFHRIALTDLLLLVKHPSHFTLLCSDPRIPLRDNLVWKAYQLLKKKTPFRQGVTVFLHKQIPVAAGLGGASSDAASFLLGMNRLCKLGLSRRKLFSLGRQLGADFPFFLSGWSSAVGLGRGDILRKLNLRKGLRFVLIAFPKGLSTRRVYHAFHYPQPARQACPVGELTKLSHDVTMLSRYFEKRDLHALSTILTNDLQEVAARFHSGIRRAIKMLRKRGVRSCLMSGSGPTVFGIVRSRNKAEGIRRDLQNRLPGCRVEVV